MASSSGPPIQDIWRLAWPAMLRNFVGTAADRLTLALVGQYDASNLAHYDGASLGKMYSNITGLSIGLGFVNGIYTLSAQSFGAKQHKQENALWLWRCGLVLLVVFLLFTVPANLFSENLLLEMDQPEDVARASATYAKVNLVGVPFIWAASALQAATDSAQDTKPGLYASAVASLLQVLLSVIAVHPALLDWGYLGLAAAGSASGMARFCLMVAIIHYKKLGPTIWTIAPNRRHLVYDAAGLRLFVAVALPPAVVWWVDWWSFEGLTVMVGLLPDATATLAAHGAMFNVLVTCYQVFKGISTAVSALVGKHVGAQTNSKIPLLLSTALTMSMAVAVVVSIGLWALRSQIASLLESEADVDLIIEKAILGPCLSVLGFAVLMTLFGACIGAGIKWSAACGVAVSYICIGLPLAYTLGVRKHWPRSSPLLGIWIGNATALACAAAWLMVLVSPCVMDWASVKRATSSSQDLDDSTSTTINAELSEPLVDVAGGDMPPVVPTQAGASKT